MSNESIYFKIGKRIGYWYMANKDSLAKQVLLSFIRKLPGGSWISRNM